MQVNGLIIEELSENGELKSFVLNKDYSIGDLWIAFPDEYDEERTSPFHFLSNSYETLYNSYYENHRMRKVGPERFEALGDKIFKFRTNWDNIPVKESYEAYYYALYLPVSAIPIEVNINYIGKSENDRIKYVKDNDRVIIYIPLFGIGGRFSEVPQNLTLDVTMKIDQEEFVSFEGMMDDRSIEMITDNSKFLRQSHIISGKQYEKFNKLMEQITDNQKISSSQKQRLSQIETPEETKILFAMSSPVDESKLRLDQEHRDISEGLRMSKNRDYFELRTSTATRIRDLRRAMLEFSPTIVHFSGHGSNEGIYLENDNGESQLIGGTSLANFFRVFSRNLKCVVLNSCYSNEQAVSISEHIPFVIGMKSEVPDRSAICFSIAFYEALGNGLMVEDAFELGVNNIEMNGLLGNDIPELIVKQRYRRRY